MTPKQRNMAKARVIYTIMKSNGTLPSQIQSFKNHPTPSKAIRLFCLDCQGGSRKAVRDCNELKCYLYQFRTKKKKQTPAPQ